MKQKGRYFHESSEPEKGDNAKNQAYKNHDKLDFLSFSLVEPYQKKMEACVQAPKAQNKDLQNVFLKSDIV